MVKNQYIARRMSSFMPFDRGNEWVVIKPTGQIYSPPADAYKMTQNDAIRLAKKLNEEMVNAQDN